MYLFSVNFTYYYTPQPIEELLVDRLRHFREVKIEKKFNKSNLRDSVK